MVKSAYTAGLRFVISTPTQGLDVHDHKSIRSHATRAGRQLRSQTTGIKSWLNPYPSRILSPERTDESQNYPHHTSALRGQAPAQFGSTFSGLQLPQGFEPYMINDLMKLLEINSHGVYPYEICLDVHPTERGWFPYMISDACCLHSMMFSAQAYTGMASQSKPSHLALLHYAQTLQLLQARINEPNYTSAISDATIMVVVTLAGVAELAEDFEAVSAHMSGLEKMVHLRGGVRALNTHTNMQAKVCRTDLIYALIFGYKPRLLDKEIKWDCFIAYLGLIKCSHQPYEHDLSVFAEAIMDEKLRNAFRDLHAFSCISNLAYQTTRKLSPETYNEMMISILYRLTYLSFNNDVLQEAMRISLLSFSSTIFMQRYILKHDFENLTNLQSSALFALIQSGIAVPPNIQLWLAILLQIVAPSELSCLDWRSVWFDEAIVTASVDTWEHASEVLRSVAWVSFVHEEDGKRIFEAATLRVQGQHTLCRN